MLSLPTSTLFCKMVARKLQNGSLFRNLMFFATLHLIKFGIVNWLEEGSLLNYILSYLFIIYIIDLFFANHDQAFVKSL